MKLEAALVAWQKQGGSVALVTLTMRHSSEQSLTDLWAALSGAWKATEHSRGVRAVRKALGVVGFVRRIEATHGSNGWHLHIHALAFIEGAAADQDAARLGDSLHASWSAHLQGRGMQAPLRSVGTDVKLLDLSDPGAAVAGYITMRSTPEGMGARELTDALGGKYGKRGNRTTWELLSDAVGGDLKARGLWWEWEEASRGKRMLTWGRKVSALLDLEDEEEADDLEATIIARLGMDAWQAVCRRPDGPSDLLEIAERAYRSQSCRGDDLEQNHVLGLEAAMLDVALTLEDWNVMPIPDLQQEDQAVIGFLSITVSRGSTVSAVESGKSDVQGPAARPQPGAADRSKGPPLGTSVRAHPHRKRAG
jgi:hypothetical protein